MRIALIFLVVKVVVSLKASNLCFMTKQNECINNDCKQVLKCAGKYKFNCGQNYCSSNMESCDKFNFLTYSLRSFRLSKMHEKQLESYLQIVRKASPCPSDIKVELNLANVCVRGANCSVIDVLPFRKLRIKQLRNISCPCLGKFPHKCLSKFCTKSELDCEIFSKTNITLIAKPKKCSNDFGVIYKKSW